MDEPIDALLLLARTDPVPHLEVVERHERQLAGAMPGRPANPSFAGAGRDGSTRSSGAARSLRRSRLALLCAAVVVVTALVLPLRVRVGSQTQLATAPPDRGSVPTGPAYAGVDPNDLASTHAKPSYLPAGAVYEGGHTVKYANGWVDSWSLTGEVNSRVMPPTPSEGTPGVWYHPATDVALVQLAQTTSTFHSADTRYTETKTVDLNGVPATLVTPINGYGDYRIAWVRGGVAYDLQTQRLKVDADGTMSGIPLDELLLMARSVG